MLYKKSEITELSKSLGWSFDITNSFFNGYDKNIGIEPYEKKDFKDFVDICINSKNEKIKFNNCVNFYLKYFNFNHLKTIIELTKNEDYLSFWLFSNKLKTIKENLNLKEIDYIDESLFFSYNNSEYLSLLNNVVDTVFSKFLKELSTQEKLKYQTHVIVQFLAHNAGFEILKLNFIHNFLFYELPNNHESEFLKNLSKIINNYYESSLPSNGWIIYFLIDSLLSYKYGHRESCRIAARILSNSIGSEIIKKTYTSKKGNKYSSESISRTYYRYKEKLQQQNLSSNNLKKKFNIDKKIRRMIIKNNVLPKNMNNDFDESTRSPLIEHLISHSLVNNEKIIDELNRKLNE